MDNTVLTAVPLFLFMGYLVERAGIVSRLFFAIRLASHKLPASMAVAALITCALFSTATGIIGAVVTLMGLLAWPAMIKAGYDKKFSSGVICAGVAEVFRCLNCLKTGKWEEREDTDEETEKILMRTSQNEFKEN